MVEQARVWTRGWIATLVVVAAVLVALGALLASNSGNGSGAVAAATGTAGPVVSRPPTSREVTYEVTGSAPGADITLVDGTGQITQARGKAVPLSGKDGLTGIHFTARAGQRLYVSAQNTGSAGTLTCRILESGRVVATNTSQGGYSIVTCEG